MKIICPVCEQPHNTPYTKDSDWCTNCTDHYLETQQDEIDLGQTFG